MLEGSRQIIHYGVNFLMAPAIHLNTERQLKFQEVLSKNKLEFDQTNKVDEKSYVFASTKTDPLEVRVGFAGPEVSQLLILSSAPSRSKDIFEEQAELICKSFCEIWKEPQQVLQRDICIRSLYQTKNAHAFQFLWEERLKQNQTSISPLGRPVLGGGLRIVMPPHEHSATQIELKIESFLRDSRMLFVEIQYVWKNLLPLADGLAPRQLIEEAEIFNKEKLMPFIQGKA